MPTGLVTLDSEVVFAPPEGEVEADMTEWIAFACAEEADRDGGLVFVEKPGSTKRPMQVGNKQQLCLAGRQRLTSSALLGSAPTDKARCTWGYRNWDGRTWLRDQAVRISSIMVLGTSV